MNVKLFNQYEVTLEESETGKFQLSNSMTISKENLWGFISEVFHLPLSYFDLLSNELTISGLTFYKNETPQKIELDLNCDEILFTIFNFSSIQLTLETETNILEIIETK